MIAHNDIECYSEYVDYLRTLLKKQVANEPQRWRNIILSSLNGEANLELRRVVDLESLRASGAFFTSHQLADRALTSLRKKLDSYRLIVDPTCGAGDLLLSIARSLPLAQSVDDTCRLWGERLAGCDKHGVFVDAAKLRLAILAVYRHNIFPKTQDLVSLADHFHLINHANSLTTSQIYKHADAIVINPPFSVTSAPSDCEWARGNVNMAAHFIDKVLSEVSLGTRIIGILPDVLRSGTRYELWRNRVERAAKILSIKHHGLFDRWTDVDVFLLDLLKKDEQNLQKKQGNWIPLNKHKSVGDLFNIHVGPIVPHRHKEEGPIFPYIHARNLPKWGYFKSTFEVRRFAGTTFDTPFVAVRRTSSPKDKHRALGTIITKPGAIAVENHLIVLIPKDGSIETCRKLIRVFQSEKANEWLNKRIRCRHLTVTSLREVPWSESE